MSKTTTDSVDNEQADVNPQPENELTNDEAVENVDDSKPISDETGEDESTTDQSSQAEEPDDTDNSETTEESEQIDEDDLKEWAEKKNLPLDDPMKVAKMYRDAEKLMHEQRQPSELKKQIGEQAAERTDEYASDAEVEQNRMLAELNVLSFYLENPDARAFEPKMVEVLEEKPHLGGDLDTLYTLAKARTSDEEKLEARKQGEQAALKKVAQSQRQGAPRTDATKPEKEPEEDLFIKGFDQG